MAFDVLSFNDEGPKWAGVRSDIEQALTDFDGHPSSVFIGGLSNALRDLYDRIYETQTEAASAAPGTNQEAETDDE